MIYNLGSINADYFYDLPHLPGPGETLAASAMSVGLGGKGANQSVAAALAGAEVCHIGAVGPDGAWAVDRMAGYGVDTTFVRQVEVATAHAIVMVDTWGENQIVIYPGANHVQDVNVITKALDSADPGDWLMLQNETSLQVEAARLAQKRGMSVAYSAAPFSADAVKPILEFTSLLILNQVEAEQLARALGMSVGSLPVDTILVTKGGHGAEWIDTKSGETVSVPAFSVDVVDTTGAGDTFAGYTVAGLSLGLSPKDAFRRASAAAAIKVTRKGTADAIPSADIVTEFLDQLPTNGAADPQS